RGKRRDPGNAPGSRGISVGSVAERRNPLPLRSTRAGTPGVLPTAYLGSLAEELGDVGHDGPDVLLGQLALEGVVDLDLVSTPHQDRDVRIPRQLVVGRAAGFSEHRQRDVLDAILVRQLADVLAGPVRLTAEYDDEALELGVLVDLLVDLLDQTGQGLGGLAREHADHRARSVPSAIAESLALVGAGDVVHVERVDETTGLQARF